MSRDRPGPEPAPAPDDAPGVPLVRAENLVKRFPQRGGLLGRVQSYVHAVNGVSLDIWPGECVGLVGESGCGKSTLGKLIVRLLEPDAGRVYFDGEDITGLTYRELRPRKRDMQIIFQDPYGSLNPRMTVEDLLGEVLRFHRMVERRQVSARIDELLSMAGLRRQVRRKYPHEFSGGQRQRIGIARALAVQPRFLLADEPVSALDVSIQAQILNLLHDLRAQFELTYLFVSHDLRLVQQFCDRVEIMYLGFIVERLPCRDLAADVRHPYARALLASLPVADPRMRGGRLIPDGAAGAVGDVPSAVDLPRGCPFVSRCPEALERCHEQRPALVGLVEGHEVACHAVTG